MGDVFRRGKIRAEEVEGVEEGEEAKTTSESSRWSVEAIALVVSERSPVEDIVQSRR